MSLKKIIAGAAIAVFAYAGIKWYVNETVNDCLNRLKDPSGQYCPEKEKPENALFEENNVFRELPWSLAKDKNTQKVSNNAVRIRCVGYGGASGAFVNPTQILTATHVIGECKPENLMISLGEKDFTLGGRVKEIFSTSLSDISVIELSDSVGSLIYSLPLRHEPLSEGLELTLLTYSPRGEKVTKKGKIVKLGCDYFEVDLPTEGGNSGGLYLDLEGQVVGVHHGRTEGGKYAIAHGIDNLKLEKRIRNITAQEKELLALLENLEKCRNAGYEDFVRKIVYLNSKGEICPNNQENADHSCLPYQYSNKVIGVATTFNAVNGAGTLESQIKFKDGKIYRSKNPYADSSNQANPGVRTSSVSIFISGDSGYSF